MSTNDSTPLGIDDNDAPFGGPDPQDDRENSTRPEADSDIDEEEYYQEGLADAAEMGDDELHDDKNDLPEGFHKVG